MLFIAFIVILLIVYFIHLTRMQLIDLLKKGNVNEALKVLTMFDDAFDQERD